MLAWAKHLDSVYKQLAKTHPEFRNTTLSNPSVLQAIASINGVPEAVLQIAQAPGDVHAANELEHNLILDRQGYASTRTGSQEDPCKTQTFAIGSTVYYHTDQNRWQEAQVQAIHCPDSTCGNVRYTLKVTGDAGSVLFFAHSARVADAPPNTLLATPTTNGPSTTTPLAINSKAYLHRANSSAYIPCIIRHVNAEEQPYRYVVQMKSPTHPQQTCNAEHSELLPEVPPMVGIDEFDTNIDPTAGLDTSATYGACTSGINSPEQLAMLGGVLMSSTSNSKCVSDYSEQWPLLLHPEAFPWGCGARPTGENGRLP